MKLRQKNAKNKLLLQYGIGITLVLLVMTTSFLYLISLSMKPYQDARVEGEKLANQYSNGLLLFIMPQNAVIAF